MLLRVALITAAIPVLVAAPHAQDKTFTCYVRAISFVLDNSDFDALKDAKVTQEKFASFPPGSAQRANVCETRRVARLAKAGKIGYSDFVALKYWRGDYLSDSEAPLVLKRSRRPSRGAQFRSALEGLQSSQSHGRSIFCRRGTDGPCR